MNRDHLIGRIRYEIRHADSDTDDIHEIAETIVDVLICEGVDLSREPSLDDTKYILVESCRRVPMCVVS